MRLTRRLTFLSVFLFMGTWNYAQEVHYNYDRAANFVTYKTYHWIDIPGGAAPDQLIDQAIKRAVDEQLAQKGLTKVEKGGQLYVAYKAAVTEEKIVNLWGTGNGPGGWSDWGWGGLNSVQGQTSTIPVGNLVVNLYDPARKQLIWRGDATKTIDLKKDPDKNYKSLQKAMAKLFKNYPPAPNK